MISKLKPKRGETGFTLLEILVAVVIIGILFALAAPVYAEQVKNGLKTSVTNDVKNVSGEMDNSWNEDEGYPLCFNQKLSDGNTANYYVNGVLVCSQAADADSPSSSGTTPSSTTGGGGTYTGGTGTGSSGGTGGTGGSSTTTYKPSTNRMLTWDEFKSANLYDTGEPFAANASYKYGGQPGMAATFSFNYTANRISSISSLLSTLKTDCSTVRFGYNQFSPKMTPDGNNLCYYIREGDDPELSDQKAVNLLAVYQLTNTGNIKWALNGESSNNTSVPATSVSDWDFPTEGTYTVIITKNPASLKNDCENWSGYGTDIRQTDSGGYSCGDYYNGLSAGDSSWSGWQWLDMRSIYDISVIYTSTKNASYSGRITYASAFLPLVRTDGTWTYWRAQGGRSCSTVVVGSYDDCLTYPASEQNYQTDDLPESWWKTYTTGSSGSGSGNDTNTDPSSTGSSGGSFAGQYVGSYFGEYCVEVTNKDLNKENGAGWQHYSSEDMKLKAGRCTT